MCQAITHHFWKRWSHEYLHQLQKLSKWHTPTTNLKINDVVILRDDCAFTCHWPVAVVLDVYPGADDLVRVVQLKVPSAPKPMTSMKDLINSPTSFTILKRPVTKVALLFRPDDSTDGSPEPSSSAPGRMSAPQQQTR